MLAMRIGWCLVWGLWGLFMLAKLRLAWSVRRDWQRDGVDAEGEVVDFETRSLSSKSGTRTVWAPVVKFQARDGGVERFTSAAAASPNPYVVGQRVPVRYRREDPTTAELMSVTTSWFPIIALLVAALVSLTVASLPIFLAPPAQK
jgi:hypothetical protein